MIVGDVLVGDVLVGDGLGSAVGEAVQDSVPE